MKKSISAKVAWKWRDATTQQSTSSSTTTLNSASASSLDSCTLPMDSESRSHLIHGSSSSSHSSSKTDFPARSPYLVGRVRSIFVDFGETNDHGSNDGDNGHGHDGDDDGDQNVRFFLSLLSSPLLPATVHSISFHVPLSFAKMIAAAWSSPSTLQSLHLGNVSYLVRHSSLASLHLPSSLTELHLGCWKGRTDQLPVLPPNLKIFHMGQTFNHPIDSIQWPQSLQSLTLSSSFNHPLESVRLPDSITYLHLGQSYDHPIESMHLPASLTELNLAYLADFDHPLEQLTLPCGLLILRLPFMWSRPIERMQFPHSITQLELGSLFNHPLLHWTPPSTLKQWSMPVEWKLEPTQIRLPSTLTILTLSHYFNEARASLNQLHLPQHIQTMRLGGKMKGDDLAALTLPQSLTSLDLGDGCDASLDHAQWPPHLTRLLVGQTFNQPLFNWSPPSSLTELSLCDESGFGWWNHPVSQLRLPPNLHKLTFGVDFNQALTGLQFPSSLRALTFGRKFKQPLGRNAWAPPPDLEELHMGTEWNLPLTDLHLPPRLRKLTLSDKFNRSIENDEGECQLNLPSTLVELRFGCFFSHSLRSLRLPPSLRFLSVPGGSAKYSVDQLPASLPARLSCLEVWSETMFQTSWAQHPQWPKQCAFKCF